MKKLLVNLAYIFLLLSLVTICVFLCAIALDDRKEESTNLFFHYYSIEPVSMLEKLETRDVNIFVPLAEEPSLILPNKQVSVTWTEEDYFNIVNALFQFSRSDTLDEWQLNNMSFMVDCQEFGTGLQNGNFRFFKINKEKQHESRIVRIVNIDPRNKFIFITENSYYPILADWTSIDLEQNQIFAGEVLQIADNNGGKEMRLSVKNACNISLSLSPDYVKYNGWEVDYSRRDNQGIFFQMEIDPVTGEKR